MWFQVNWSSFDCGFNKIVQALYSNEINHLRAVDADTSVFSAHHIKNPKKIEKVIRVIY